MMVYHGTDEPTARAAASVGLVPRQTQPSRWDDVPSHPDHVYLTRYFAGYYGANAADRRKGQRMGIVEIELAQLDPSLLYPDEDYVADVMRKRVPMNVLDRKGRIRYVRDHIELFQGCAGESLLRMGNVAHRGAIPASAIRRVALWDGFANPHLFMRMVDQNVGVLGAAVSGPSHEFFTRWLIGDDVTVDEFMEAEYGPTWRDIPLVSGQVPVMRRLLANRNGWELIADAPTPKTDP